MLRVPHELFQAASILVLRFSEFRLLKNRTRFRGFGGNGVCAILLFKNTGVAQSLAGVRI